MISDMGTAGSNLSCGNCGSSKLLKRPTWRGSDSGIFVCGFCGNDAGSYASTVSIVPSPVEEKIHYPKKNLQDIREFLGKRNRKNKY